MSATIVQSGEYDLLIDTGFDYVSFTLDSAEKGILDEDILGPTSSYASVIDGATNISVFRGRRDIGDQGILAGTMSFELLDTTGIFNPFDDQGPFFDPSNNQPGLAPLRRVILSRENEVLFKGYITTYSYSFELGELDRVSVNCADDFYYLAQTYLDEWNVTEQLSSDRVTDLLDLPEVNFPALERNISTGTVTLGGASAYTVANGTSVANYAAQIQQAEQGRIFIDRNGNFTFQPRLGNTLGGSVIDFHDNGDIGTAGYDAVGIAFDADQVVNRASVTRLSGSGPGPGGAATPQVAEDLASQAQYLIQTTSITGSLLHNDAAALALAEYLLVPNPEPRFTDVSVAFVSLTEAQRDLAAVVDIGDTITIQKTIQQGASFTEFAQELAIEGVQHQINVLSGHRVTFFTSPTTIVYELILDSAQFGQIDALNVLG
jgi:hypothetical protein